MVFKVFLTRSKSLSFVGLKTLDTSIKSFILAVLKLFNQKFQKYRKGNFVNKKRTYMDMPAIVLYLEILPITVLTETRA